MSRAAYQWTDELDRRLLDGTETRKAFAAELGISLSTLKVRLRFLRGLTPERASTSAYRPIIKWSEIDHKLLAWRKSGETFSSISLLSGVSFTSVRRRLKYLKEAGVYQPGDGPEDKQEEELEAELVKKPPKYRPCLGCRKNFLSEDWDNRFCRKCKRNERRAEAVHGLTEYGVRI